MGCILHVCCILELPIIQCRVVSSKLIVSGRSKCRRIRSSKKAADSNLEASLLSARPRNVLDGKRPHGRVLAEPAEVDHWQWPRRRQRRQLPNLACHGCW